jgi:glycine cleavage system aminomethyltransferase T
MEKITDLDLVLPAEQTACLVQGPVLDGPCQVMILSAAGSSTGLLLAVSRGSGQSVVDAILDAGGKFGPQPAGEEVFKKWLRNRV